MTSHIEIFNNGQWIQAASLDFIAQDRCRFEYLPQYVFADWAVPVALNMPLELGIAGGMGDEAADRRPPAFIFDLIPQGRGRHFLVDLLKLSDSDALIGPLIEHGAFNPIGCLRIDTAVSFYERQAQLNPDPAPATGFDLQDIMARSEDFLEHLSLHAMLAAGTTGVQGVAPKFLLTQDRDDRWYADLALSDERAAKHWLVKLPRGRTEDDLLVHRNEAAYMRVAQACGLRTNGEPMLHGNMLFLRRFDRVVTEQGLHRLHQESLASLADLRGFGLITTQNALLAAVREHASNRLMETIEFIKRDVLNFALRNTDNHARNTAMQRLPNGEIALTPVFDFAPMFKDPEIVPRSIHWRDAEGNKLVEWRDVIDDLAIPLMEKRVLCAALVDFGSIVGRLDRIALDCGVDKVIVDACLRSIESQARQLEDLKAFMAMYDAAAHMEPAAPATKKVRATRGA